MQASIYLTERHLNERCPQLNIISTENLNGRQTHQKVDLNVRQPQTSPMNYIILPMSILHCFHPQGLKIQGVILNFTSKIGE